MEITERHLKNKAQEEIAKDSMFIFQHDYIKGFIDGGFYVKDLVEKNYSDNSIPIEDKTIS